MDIFQQNKELMSKFESERKQKESIMWRISIMEHLSSSIGENAQPIKKDEVENNE